MFEVKLSRDSIESGPGVLPASTRIRDSIAIDRSIRLAFWRKKDNDFEWRDYVRTTILLRRQERRQKVEDVKAAAVDSVKKGGRWSADQVSSAGATLWARIKVAVAGPVARLSSVSISGAFGRFLGALGTAAGVAGRGIGGALRGTAWFLGDRLGPGLSRGLAWTGGVLEPAGDFLRRPQIALPVTIIAVIAAVTVALKLPHHGLNGDVLLAGVLAVAATLLLVVPRLAGGAGFPALGAVREGLERFGDTIVLLPGFDRLRPLTAAVVAVLSLAVLGGAGVAWLWHDGPPQHRLASAAPIKTEAAGALAGPASAVDGATLRVSDRLVRLDGIEAPDPDQICSKPGTKRWRCGSSAREALARVLRGRRVTCDVNGSGAAGAPAQGRCVTSTGLDVAAELVRGGHVFAEAGLFASYGSDEQTAKASKAGLWAGTAERPEEWRQQRWETAKRAAPGGCPIKGQVSAGSRVYVLPWSPAYDRVRIREGRGERWFCSEDEARAAGWRLGQRS